MAVKAKGLDHVAIVVEDLEKALAFYKDSLGLELSEIEIVPEQHVKTAIFGRGMGRVELICPITDDSGVARFLRKRGEGLHHICLEVEDLQATLGELKAKGLPLIDESPRPGAGGSQVAFVHPKGCHGVLTELRQGPRRRP